MGAIAKVPLRIAIYCGLCYKPINLKFVNSVATTSLHRKQLTWENYEISNKAYSIPVVDPGHNTDYWRELKTN